VIVLPAMGFIYYKIQKIESHYNLLMQMVTELKKLSDFADIELGKN
jgi:hypothetical protein